MNNAYSTLIKELRNIFDDVEFVFGILSYVQEEKDRQKLLNFIQSREDVSVETVTVMALDLNDARREGR